jgi:hypothetical protein
MYWMQWSRSAGLSSGPVLSMMRMQASCVRISIFLMRSISPSGHGQLLVDVHRGLDRGLRMELGRERDLEQHVLHHVAAVAAGT